MNIIKKIIDILKKFEILKAGVRVNTYKSSKDKGYQPPDPLE